MTIKGIFSDVKAKQLSLNSLLNWRGGGSIKTFLWISQFTRIILIICRKNMYIIIAWSCWQCIRLIIGHENEWIEQNEKWYNWLIMGRAPVCKKNWPARAAAHPCPVYRIYMCHCPPPPLWEGLISTIPLYLWNMYYMYVRETQNYYKMYYFLASSLFFV